MPERFEGRVEGPAVAVADVRVTLAEVVFEEQVRRPFILRLTDGSALRVETSQAEVQASAPTRIEGRWSDIAATPLGASLRTVSAGPHVRGVLEAHTVGAGAKVRVHGTLVEAPPAAGSGYREGGSSGEPATLRARLISSGAAHVSEPPAAPPAPTTRPRVRVDRYEPVGLLTAMGLALVAAAVMALPGFPRSAERAFLNVAWAASLLGLATLFYERARAVPSALPGAPLRRFLPRFVSLLESDRATAPAGRPGAPLLAIQVVLQGMLAPGAVEELVARLGVTAAAPGTALDGSALECVAGALALVFVLAMSAHRWWGARHDLVVVRELLFAPRGVLGTWSAWSGTVRAEAPLRQLTAKYEGQGAGRTRTRWVVMRAASNRSATLVVDGAGGPLRVALRGASAGSVERESGEGLAWREVARAGAGALVVGTVTETPRGRELSSSGPGTVLVFTASGPSARRELLWCVLLHHAAIALVGAGSLLAVLAAIWRL